MKPIDGVEDGIGATVAGVQIVDAFDVGVTGGLEQLHQHGLAGFGFVKHGFGADFEAADAGKINGIFADEGSQGGQGNGIDVLAVSVLDYDEPGPCYTEDGCNLTFSVVAEANLNHQDQQTNGSINGHHHQQQPHAPTPPDEDSPPSTPETTTTTLPLDTFDFLIFHSPTCKLVTKAHARLLYLSFLSNPTHPAFASLSPPDRSHLLALDHQASLTDKTLEKTFLALAKERFQARVQPSVNVPTMCGNMYCASVYGALASLLCGASASGDSNALIGKRIGVYSYGGGLAASFFSLRIRASVEGMVKKLDLQRRLDSRAGVSVDEYLEVSLTLSSCPSP